MTIHLRQPRCRTRVLRVCLLVGSLLLVIALLSPAILQYLFFQMPSPSAEFDCDDSTLLMLHRLSRLGITATPILGNLKITGEKYLESDHVWLLVDIFGLRIAFDWGSPRFGKQHYEGYLVTHTDLLEFVAQDLRNEANQVTTR